MMDKTITIIQINKGDSELNKRIVQINYIIQKFKPHIIVINELNLTSDDTITRKLFDNYNLETDNLDMIDQMSRTGVLVHKNLHYKRRKDLEVMGISTVWIQLQHPVKNHYLSTQFTDSSSDWGGKVPSIQLASTADGIFF